MIEQLDLLEKAIENVQETISRLKRENEHFKIETTELKSIIEDRDIEILQLQEDLQKIEEKKDSDNNEVESRLQVLLGKMTEISLDDAEEETYESDIKESNEDNDTNENNNNINNNTNGYSNFRF
ncbi:MAG: hypothetical protein RR272_01385 [Synergistaceae bacterium]